MNGRLRACLLAGAACAALSCGPEPGLAGGTGIETTNGIAGAVHDGTSPVRNARVSLYPGDFNPYRDTLPDSLRGTTGDDGRFEFRGIPEGRYNVLAETSPQGIATMILDVAVGGKGKVTLETRELRARGAVRVPRGEGVAQGAGYLYIPGSPWIVSMSDVEGEEESVLLPDLAPAVYRSLRFVGGDADLDTNILVGSLEVRPGETVTVNPYLGWAHSRALRLNTMGEGAATVGDVAGFPILVRLDATRLDFSQAAPEGRDLRFGRPDGMPLAYHIERWDAAQGKAEIWVRVDTVKGNDTSSIRMYWGKEGAVDIGDSRRVFRIADGFAAVWHFDGDYATDSSGAPVLRNAVEDANHALEYLRSDGRDGAVGLGQAFDGIEYLKIPDPTDRLKPARNLTVSGWYLFAASDSGGAVLATMGDSWGLKMDQNGKTRLFVYVDSAHRSPITKVSVMDHGWHLLTGSYDGSFVRSYVDGVLLDSVAVKGDIAYTLGKEFYFGRHGNGLTNVDAIGNIDEIEVSTTTRSADFIKLLYESQKPNASWIEFR